MRRVLVAALPDLVLRDGLGVGIEAVCAVPVAFWRLAVVIHVAGVANRLSADCHSKYSNIFGVCTYTVSIPAPEMALFS